MNDQKIVNGDIRIVNLSVKVLFEWSDRIVSDYDSETGKVLVYESGFVMNVLPGQSIPYKGEETVLFANTVKN